MSKVLDSCLRLRHQLADVRIDANKVREFTAEIANMPLDNTVLTAFPPQWSDLQYFHLTLVFNCMNFCYWAEVGQDKWKVAIDGEIFDGSMAMLRSIERAFNENPELWDWHFVQKLTRAQFSAIFLKDSVGEIPLLQERYENLVSLATSIIGSYDGQTARLLSESHYCAGRMLKRLTKFPCFQDESQFAGHKLVFWKRA